LVVFELKVYGLLLARCGRSKLIKSTLSNLLTLKIKKKKKILLSLFPLSLGVANHIEELQWDFLWGGIDKEFKFHLLGWTKSRFLDFGWKGLVV
jgi:hypothetical protein